MSEQMYRCWYDDPQGQRRSVDTNKGVWFCQEGFWVDDEWQYAVDLDKCLHWIPPHRIVLLSKLPPEQSDNGDLTQAIRLLHVLRAYSWTPGNVPDPARDDPLYPGGECNAARGQLWQAVDILLKRHEYPGHSASSNVGSRSGD